jgi:formylglycine-generating enzyme
MRSAHRRTLVLFATLLPVFSCASGRPTPDQESAGPEFTDTNFLVQGPHGDSEGAGSACPPGMVLVEGNYCPDVEQKCLRWMDPPGPYQHFRCAEYAQPSRCSGARVPMRFCIDRVEFASEGAGAPAQGTTVQQAPVPQNFLSFSDGQRLCAARGARLCKESEWQFACEGEEMRPYPYGFVRDATACNTDITHNLGRTGRLVDHRAPGGAFGRCKSPFGVYDLSGNLEEWVEADNRFQKGAREVMKGSWWIPSRHACRSFQIGHGSEYGGGETGIRCCRGAE